MTDERDISKAKRKAWNRLKIGSIVAAVWDDHGQRFALKPPDTRPFTWVAMLFGVKQEPRALGVVFNVWPKHMTHLRFQLTREDGKEFVEVATFHELPGFERDRFIIVPKRWCWDRLLKEFQGGLSAGNM